MAVEDTHCEVNVQPKLLITPTTPTICLTNFSFFVIISSNTTELVSCDIVHMRR
jgi:hypothetical protein